MVGSHHPIYTLGGAYLAMTFSGSAVHITVHRKDHQAEEGLGWNFQL